MCCQRVRGAFLQELLKNPRLLLPLNTFEEPLLQTGQGFQAFIHWLARLCATLGIRLLDPASKVRALSVPDKPALQS